MSNLYCFTEDQLWKLLRETINLYEENRTVHGQEKKLAVVEAISGTVDGLDAEAMLIEQGQPISPTFRLMEEPEMAVAA